MVMVKKDRRAQFGGRWVREYEASERGEYVARLV